MVISIGRDDQVLSGSWCAIARASNSSAVGTCAEAAPATPEASNDRTRTQDFIGRPGRRLSCVPTRRTGAPRTGSTGPGHDWIDSAALMLNVAFRFWGHLHLYDYEELRTRALEADSPTCAGAPSVPAPSRSLRASRREPTACSSSRRGEPRRGGTSDPHHPAPTSLRSRTTCNCSNGSGSRACCRTSHTTRNGSSAWPATTWAWAPASSPAETWGSRVPSRRSRSRAAPLRSRRRSRSTRRSTRCSGTA